MAVALITQNQTQSTTGVTSVSFDLNISSSSAEMGVAVYISSGTISSVTVGGSSATVLGTTTRWYGLTGINNGIQTVVVTFTGSTSNFRVWAGAFSDVYQTNGFVSLQNQGVVCSSGSTGSFQGIYSTDNPTNDCTPSVGYRTLRGVFPFASSDNTYNSSSPGCAGLGYYNNVPYTTQATFDNATGTYEKIMMNNSVISTTTGSANGSAFDGKCYEYGATSLVGGTGNNNFLWVVTGNGTTLSASQVMIF